MNNRIIELNNNIELKEELKELLHSRQAGLFFFMKKGNINNAVVVVVSGCLSWTIHEGRGYMNAVKDLLDTDLLNNTNISYSHIYI